MAHRTPPHRSTTGGRWAAVIRRSPEQSRELRCGHIRSNTRDARQQQELACTSSRTRACRQICRGSRDKFVEMQSVTRSFANAPITAGTASRGSASTSSTRQEVLPTPTAPVTTATEVLFLSPDHFSEVRAIENNVRPLFAFPRRPCVRAVTPCGCDAKRQDLRGVSASTDGRRCRPGNSRERRGTNDGARYHSTEVGGERAQPHTCFSRGGVALLG